MKDMAPLVSAVLLMIYSNVVMKMRAVANSGPHHVTGVVDYLLAMLRDPLVWTAGAATAGAMVLWLISIRRVDLSVAHPMIASIFVAVPLAAVYFLNEPMPPLRGLGLALIAFGILLVAKTA